MSETITRARELIQSRLDEVAGEVESLSGALEALGANGASAAPTRRRRRRSEPIEGPGAEAVEPAPKPRGRGKGKRTRGKRADQVKALALLAAANPEASNADIAEALGIGASSAAVLLSNLKKAGVAQRVDGKLVVGKVSSTGGQKRKGAKRGKAKATAKRGKARRTRKAKPKDDVADAIEMLDI